MEREVKAENEWLQSLIAMEDLAEKKTQIYARLLIDTDLAKKMEELSARHLERRARLEKLLYSKSEDKKGGQRE